MEKMVSDLQTAQIPIDEESINLDQAEFGLPRAPAGTWGSCVRIVDPVTVRLPLRFISKTNQGRRLTRNLRSQAETVFKLDLTNNEAAFSAAIVTFHSVPNEIYLVVGTGEDTSLAPRACKQAWLNTYRVTDEGKSIELLHKVRTFISSYIVPATAKTDVSYSAI